MRILLLVILCLCPVELLGQGSLETDRQALVSFYMKTAGDLWSENTGWVVPGNAGDNPCGWYGVTCEGGRVTKLVLEDNGIVTSIPAVIGSLSALKHLDLSGPGGEFLYFRGDLPVELGNLTNLEYLDLSANQLSGVNVSVIGNLTNLKHLSLTPYTWSIPASFSSLTNLEYLYMAVEDYAPFQESGKAGPIPAYFGNFTKLKTLIMRWGGVTGTIPSQLGNLANLEVLDLSHNELTGTVPATFSNLSKMTKLDLSFNQLESYIPNLSGIPVSANVNIAENKFTFGGMEANIAHLDVYAPQSDIEVTFSNGLPPTAIYASGGGFNDVYKWYLQDQLIFTGESGQLLISEDGLYKVEITNTMVPGLTLKGQIDVTILPVTLVSFDGKSQNSQTKLTWKTTSETNNKGFEIERSADARIFEKIGFVDGNGDSKGDNMYHFADLQPFETSYYRLKQLDYDGKFEYSRVIAVKGDGAAVRIYPNPAQGELTVTGYAANAPVSVFTQTGKMAMDKVKLSSDGKLDVSHLKEGIYTIKIDGTAKKLLIKR